MAQRFKTAPVPTGEVSSHVSDPYNLSSIYLWGSSSPFTGAGSSIVRPSDDLLISKGGNRAISVYQRLLFDEHVQASFSKLVQEITSRPWYIEEYSQKPGDLAVRDYLAEVLEELPLDEIYKGLCEALVIGFSVGEVMWKKTKRGVIPYDIRMRDQRRFVFQENEESQTGFTMRCLTFNRMFEGIELPSRKFIVNRHWAFHNGDPYGAALGRVLYPLVKFRRRAIESYVLYGDRYATPTVVATAPLSASTAEVDKIYDHISNLSQETALVLPEGFKLDFVNPTGNPDVFKNLIDYIDREISLLICGENEAGQAESGSRASSQVANVVRVVKASELSEIISQTLTRTLVRWVVDLNFGVDVAAPTLKREFRIEESQLTVSDVSMLMQQGFKPKREWVERHFRVDLEEEPPEYKPGGQEEEGNTKFDPEKDKDLYESIFGPEETPESGTPETAPEVAPEVALEGTTPEGTTPEETAPTEGTPEGTPEEAPVEETPEVAPEEETPEEAPIEETPEEVPVEESPEVAPEETPEETTEVAPTEETPEVTTPEETPEVAPEGGTPPEEVAPTEETPEVATPEETPTEETPEEAPTEEVPTDEDIDKIIEGETLEVAPEEETPAEEGILTDEEIDRIAEGEPLEEIPVKKKGKKGKKSKK